MFVTSLAWLFATNATVLRPDVPAWRASSNVRRVVGLPTPKSEGGTKKFLQYEMIKKKMIGARNARTVVVNQCRPKTIKRFFLVKVHVCAKKPMMKRLYPDDV